MKNSDWLKDTIAQLEATGIATARLDCLVLLEDETGKDRAWLLAHAEFELQGSVLKKLSTKVAQRAQHVPLAYIRGKAEFYGREFAVNAHTLVPRPETETIIDLLLWLVGSGQQTADSSTSPASRHAELVSASRDSSGGILKRVQDDADITLVDVGTGSGAIAITAKLELPQAHVIATDIDKNCLKIAQANAKNLGADISFSHGDLLAPLLQGRTLQRLQGSSLQQILLANLPYVPDNFQINRAATHEPRHALFGGPDGLDLYRKLFNQINSLEAKPLYILTESLPPQHESLAMVAEANGYALRKTDDFIQVFVARDV